MNPQEEIPNIKDGVEKVLRDYPAARNSDISLIYFFIRDIEGVDITYRDFRKISAVKFESIRRARQKFQEKGAYPPTDEAIREERARNSKEMVSR